MVFSKRYPLWMILPPLVIGGPLALLFLFQVVQMTWDRWLNVLAIGAAIYVPAVIIYWRWLVRLARGVDEAIDGTSEDDVSGGVSSCLVGTERGALLFWPVFGGLLAGCLGLVMTSSIRGVSYFVESSLIVATIAMAWSYWAGKKLLLGRVRGMSGVHYRGPRFSFRIKIAMVFVGFFMVSTGAMVQLVSARVSETLEIEALEASRDRWKEVSTALGADPSRQQLIALKRTLPVGFDLHLIDPVTETVTVGDELEQNEIETIASMGTGDSLQIQSSKALLFERTDGSIAVMSMPIELIEVARQIEYFALIVALITTVMFLIATWSLSDDLTSPVREMTLVSEKMSTGDFTALGSVYSDDEVGLLSRALFDTRENLRRLLTAVGVSGESVTRGVRVIRDGTETLVVQAGTQKQLTESSASAVSEVRDVAESILEEADGVGDLTRDSASRAIELQSSVEAVSRNMEHLFESVASTSASVVQIDASANETSRRAQVLAGIGEEVLTYVSEMDSTVDQFRQSTRDTAEMSQKVRDVARSGADAVIDTVKGIEQAREASQKTSNLLGDLQKNIGEINLVVKVIEELAENTNLLSLNASIIAAQAGDRDMGFSVVAEEIRQLADRTRQSTGEIHKIIRVIAPATDAAVMAMKSGLGQVERSVGLAEKASTALAEIGDSAERTSEMTGQIATALEQHAKASSHLLQIASGISDDIAAISRATSEQAESTRLLATEAERVRDIAGQVRHSTEEQSGAAAGITEAMERIAEGEERMRERLRIQLEQSDEIARVGKHLKEIANQSDEIARNFTRMIEDLTSSGRSFETEFARFRLDEGETLRMIEGGRHPQRTLRRIAR